LWRRGRRGRATGFQGCGFLGGGKFYLLSTRGDGAIELAAECGIDLLQLPFVHRHLAVAMRAIDGKRAIGKSGSLVFHA
tara:strand:- start:239 stop:475 length:237 start_codon:yes stop_codon:yes gene_type:complete